MITLVEAQAATGGSWLTQPLPPQTPLQGGCFDTRRIGGAQTFFALPGEHADGHDFLPRLSGSGVRLAVVSREVAIPGFDGAVLRVPDVLRALAGLGAATLRKHAPKVVAITGSYGKTTAKEIIAHVLAGRLHVLKTPGSLNNEIGVPISLLDLDGTQQVAVLEFSARKPGDIDYLGRIAPPDVAVLLAVGQAHIGVFGSREAIARTKGEIFHHLRPGGLAVVNGDDPALAPLAAGHRMVTFGCAPADLRAVELTHDGLGRQRFTGLAGETRVAFRSGIPGVHGLYPVLAAWAVARELGLPDELVAERAALHPQQKGRAVQLRAPGGALLLDDTYNASPETVVNLIRSLGTMDARERILVLGHLSELEEGLGATAATIGRALQPPLTRCFVHAPHTPAFFAQLQAAAGDVALHDVATLDALAEALRAADRPGVLIGIKGARSAHLERVVQMLLGRRVDCRLSQCPLILACTDCPAVTVP